jgi:hypothetical protein
LSLATLFNINRTPSLRIAEELERLLWEFVQLERQRLAESREGQYSEFAPMRRLLSKDDEDVLSMEHPSLKTRLRKERRKAFLGYLILLKTESRDSFLTTMEAECECGKAEMGNLFRRRAARELALLRLRWLVVEAAFGASIDSVLVERLINTALTDGLSRQEVR